jgi:hypothetical protein
VSIVVVELVELERLIRRAVESAVARPSAADEWVDARSSPLPRRAFLKLAREGAFAASLVGNKYMARRSDVDAYLERQRIRGDSSGPEAARSNALSSGVAEGVAPSDDPIARALAAGRLRIVKNSG